MIGYLRTTAAINISDLNGKNFGKIHREIFKVGNTYKLKTGYFILFVEPDPDGITVEFAPCTKKHQVVKSCILANIIKIIRT